MMSATSPSFKPRWLATHIAAYTLCGALVIGVFLGARVMYYSVLLYQQLELLSSGYVSTDGQSVMKLIQNGALVNTCSGVGICALDIASYNRDVDGIAFLLQRGAYVDGPKPHLGTPLMTASGTGQVATVDQFIRAGADVNAKSQDGYTVLFWAVQGGEPRVVNLLIVAGADARELFPLPGKPGRKVTPLAYARLRGKDNVADEISRFVE